MKTIKKALLLILPLIIFTACKNNESIVGENEITGTVEVSERTDIIVFEQTVVDTISTTEINDENAEVLLFSDKSYAYDWQRAFAEYFDFKMADGWGNEIKLDNIKRMYIDDINGDGIPEVMISDESLRHNYSMGILYYSSGEIKGFVGYYFRYMKYFPEVNQIVDAHIGANGGAIILFAYNADINDYEPIAEYSGRFGEEYEKAASELEYANSALEFTPLTFEDVSGDWRSYLEENLFY